MKQCIDQEYPYQIKSAIPIFRGVIGGLAAIAFTSAAMTNHRALILNHVWIPQEAATIFYWVMSVWCACLFVVSVRLAIQARLHPRRISLSEHSVSVPKSRWSSRMTSIPYATISDMAEIKLRGKRFLYITHPGGKTIVNAALFATERDYDPFCQSLIERVNASRGPLFP